MLREQERNRTSKKTIVTVAKQRALNIRKSYTSFSKILPNFYLSSCRAVTIENLEEAHIGGIVDLSCLNSTRIVLQKAASKNMDLITFQIRDDPQCAMKLKSALGPIFQFIDKHRSKNKGVLVHCQAGISRSAAVVIGYLMNVRKIPFEDAFKYTRRRRPQIKPNKGFQAMLKNLQFTFA
jgi:predicted protein tyrosine phosphatase